jgi:hypothetical protein
VRDGLGAVAHAELAEQPAGVGLHGVLGQVELAADLAVALALAHPAQHLQLALGQLDTGVGRGAGGRDRGAGQGVRQRRHQLRAGRVPAEVAAGAAGDGRGDAAGVVRGTEHDHVGLRVGGHQPARRLDARGHRALGPDEHHVHGLTGEAGQQLVPVGHAVDPVHAGHRGHHAGQPFADAATIVANKYRRHDDSFLQLPAAG